MTKQVTPTTKQQKKLSTFYVPEYEMSVEAEDAVDAAEVAKKKAKENK